MTRLSVTPPALNGEEMIYDHDGNITIGNGFCYLLFCVPAHHESMKAHCRGPNPTAKLVKSWFEANPSTYYPGCFQATLGTTYGTTHNMVRHVGVCLVKPQVSRLTAKQLLTALPDEWSVGGLANEALPQSLVNAAPSSLSRAFLLCKPGCDTGTTVGNPTVVTFSPYEHITIKNVVNPWPVATALSLSTRITPTPNSHLFFTEVAWCWIAAGDSVPKNFESIWLQPIHGRCILAPPVDNGYFDAVSLPDPLNNAGLTPLIKPAAQISRPPVLVLIAKATRLGGDFKAGVSLFDLEISIEVQIGASGFN